MKQGRCRGHRLQCSSATCAHLWTRVLGTQLSAARFPPPRSFSSGLSSAIKQVSPASSAKRKRNGRPKQKPSPRPWSFRKPHRRWSMSQSKGLGGLFCRLPLRLLLVVMVTPASAASRPLRRISAQEAMGRAQCTPPTWSRPRVHWERLGACGDVARAGSTGARGKTGTRWEGSGRRTLQDRRKRSVARHRLLVVRQTTVPWFFHTARRRAWTEHGPKSVAPWTQEMKPSGRPTLKQVRWSFTRRRRGGPHSAVTKLVRRGGTKTQINVESFREKESARGCR